MGDSIVSFLMNAHPQIEVSKVNALQEKLHTRSASHIPRRAPSSVVPQEESEPFVFVSITCDYAAKNAGELSLEETDIVRIYPSKTSNGMVYGMCNDQKGWFPESITRSLTEDEVVQEGLLQVEEKEPLSRTASQNQVNQKWYSIFMRPEPAKSTGDLQSVPETEAKPKKRRDRAPGQRLLWADFIGKEQLEKLQLTKEEVKRQEVIFEIITTEEDYVEDLELILNLYIRPLEKNKLIRPKDMAILFSNIEQVLPVNVELLRSLDEQQQRNQVIDSVGEILIRVSDYLKMYTMYCSNHPYALMKLQSVRQNKSVAKFLDSVQMMPQSCKMDLSHFLLKPIQRVCKYPLFVRELLRYTKPEHPDHEALHRALIKIEAVVTTINEGARHAENVHKMLELQSKFVTKVSLISPSRVLKKTMQIDGFNIYGEKRKREVYVFNDMLVVTKPDGDKYKLLSMLSFDNITLNPGANEEEEESNKDTSKEPKEGGYKVEVTCGKEKVVFMFETSEKRANWCKLVQDSVDDYVAQKQRIMQANGNAAQLIASPEPTPTTISFEESPTISKPRSASALPAPTQRTSSKPDLPMVPKLAPILETPHSLPKDTAPTAKNNHISKIPMPFLSKAPPEPNQNHHRSNTAPVTNPQAPPPKLKSTAKPEETSHENASFSTIEQVVLKPTNRKITNPSPPPPTITKVTEAPTASHSPPVSHHQPSNSFSSKIPVKKPTIISKPVSKATVLCVTRTNLWAPLSASNSSLNSITSLGASTNNSSHNFFYTIEVETISKQSYQISKTFEEFFELHLGLIGHFPECAGIVVDAPQAKFGVSLHSHSSSNVGQATQQNQQRILPQLPQQMMFVSEQVAQGRVTSLQVYIDVHCVNLGPTKVPSKNIQISIGFEIL